MSRWHEDLAAHDEAFACLQDLFTPQSFAMTAVKAIREWGQRLLRLSAALVKENDALERENASLRERIAELERRAALDSTTSSRPPASDGLKKKSGDREKRTRSQRGKSDRPSGGQPGHKGTTLERTATPDHVVDHDPSACAGCGAPLSGDDRHGAPVCRQVFDVPEPQPLEVTEHRGHRCLCAACGTVTTAAFPNGVSAPVQYGPRISAWVTYLLHAQFIPEKRVAEVMSDLFAVEISTATIAAMGRRTARRFDGFLDRLAEIIRTAAPVKHLDETGIRIAARTRWLHVLCTPLLTILRVATGRSHIDEKLNGIVIHDDYATYFALEGVRHGACALSPPARAPGPHRDREGRLGNEHAPAPHPCQQSRPLRPQERPQRARLTGGPHLANLGPHPRTRHRLSRRDATRLTASPPSRTQTEREPM